MEHWQQVELDELREHNRIARVIIKQQQALIRRAREERDDMARQLGAIKRELSGRYPVHNESVPHHTQESPQ